MPGHTPKERKRNTHKPNKGRKGIEVKITVKPVRRKKRAKK